MQSSTNETIENPIENIDQAIEGSEVTSEAPAQEEVPSYIKALQDDLAETKRALANINNSLSQADIRELQKELAVIKAEQARAVTANDLRMAIEKEKQIVAAMQPPKQELPVEVIGFIDKNRWWNDPNHKELQNRAIILEKNYQVTNPGASIKDRMDYVDRQIRIENPDHAAFRSNAGAIKMVTTDKKERQTTQETAPVSDADFKRGLDTGDAAYFDYLVDRHPERVQQYKKDYLARNKK